MSASAQVIAARTAILADGLADPLSADLTEISLMGSEKAEALAASAGALASHAGATGGRWAEAALVEGRHAARAAADVMAAATPAEAAQAQMRYALGWWGRAGAQWLALGADMERAQSAAVAPIHAAATANARRLGKR
ncbi:MAG: phasin [Brevundimonas sp.]|nr:phasin [Brevundimonas sp.]